MANRNYASGGKIYSMHVKPVMIDCNFVVDAADSDGLGITDLKGPMIQNVFMNTSATPGAGNSNPSTPNVTVTNPDPEAGTIVVQFQNGFNRLFTKMDARCVALTGSDVKIDNSAMTAGRAYVITTVGDATAAKWRAIGVPAGVTPAVGVSFIAASNGGAGNTLTSRVQAAATEGSGIASIEMVGDPNTTMNPAASANQGFGAQIVLQCRDYAGALANPADGSLISLCFYISDSSVLIQGE